MILRKRQDKPGWEKAVDLVFTPAAGYVIRRIVFTVQGYRERRSSRVTILDDS